MQISSYISEFFYLDGGAMFGAVPKTLWSRVIVADAANRIRLACRLLVIRTAERLVLIDAGCGKKWSAKQQGIYSFEPQSSKLLQEILPDVTDVILTHLHFDHCGGTSYATSSEFTELSFPNATHYVQETHWRHAQNPGVRERATFLSSNLEPLAKAKLRLTKDREEVLPGIRLHCADGHTHGLQWVEITTENGTFAFASELIPTVHHLPLPYVMGYDLSAEKTMEEKSDLIDKAIAGNWTIVFGHDAETAAATIMRNSEGRVVVRDQIPLSQVLYAS